MRKSLFFLLGLLLISPAFGQGYQFTVDLVNVVDDKIKVECLPPRQQGEAVIYRLPKIVPGTYAIYDFGRFVHDFEAFDANGNALKITREDINSWKIEPASQLAKIQYQVEDTWDSKVEGESVFEPGGSGFERNKNFTINTHCLFGYFDGQQETSYSVKYLKLQGFYGATSLIPIESTDQYDVFETSRYFDLVDAPIMYNLPDTALVNIGGAEIEFAVYSPHDYVSAAFIKKEVTKVLLAQQAYLGGKLPIKRYVFIIYLFDGFGLTGSYGALEHNYSSLYFLPETFAAFIAQSIRDIAAHEFFHIITPLSIHSKEIHNFDFSNPDMSKHLWLYEGVTEYTSHLVQVREGLVPLDGFLDVLRDKIQSASQYQDSLPFTVMSEGCLDKYKDQYPNVYEKGALIGMCLDLILLRESDGKYGLKQLMDQLAEEYGKDTPFDDELLFGKIEALTNPAAGTFLRTYVGGPNPLPLTELLDEAGIEYHKEVSREVFSMGGVEFEEGEKGAVEVGSTWDMDDFGDLIGYRRGDILAKFNGKRVKWSNFRTLLNKYFADAEAGDRLEMMLKRKENGKWEKLKVSVALKTEIREEEDYIGPKRQPTEKELNLRRAWLGNYLEN
ncbi:MAG: peptidase M61 [Bacteroidia bacterium]|nr:peptidase M61 [Bacteroidia bacterium]